MRRIIKRAVYRFWQGTRALAAWVRPVEDTLAEDTLTPDLFALYCRMRRIERQHSLRVLRDLRAHGHTEPDVLVAALLHDVGKTRARFSLPEKVLVVLVKAFAPARYHRWGNGPLADKPAWQRPFAVSAQHPAWGAEMVAAAGGRSLAVELIRRHADPLDGTVTTESDRLLIALQTADDRN